MIASFCLSICQEVKLVFQIDQPAVFIWVVTAQHKIALVIFERPRTFGDCS